MDNQGRRFSEDTTDPTKVFDVPQTEKSKTKEAEREERKREKNAQKLEKLMKKKRRREEQSSREVLSYEDMPLEERKEREEKTKKFSVKLNKKRIVAAILILILAFGIVFIATNSDKLSWHNINNFIQYGILNRKSDENFPVSVQGETISPGNFVRMGQDVCCASDTRIQIINNYGKKEFSAQHGLTGPILVACDKYALIYSLGGTGYQINSYQNTIVSANAKNKILVADIIDNGTYALVTQSDGYLSKLYVYNKDNEQIFAYSFADYYVTSVSLHSSGKYAVVTGLSALNGAELSSIYVLDFTENKPLYVAEFEDNIFYEAAYLNGTYACAIGNHTAAVINTKNGEVKKKDYAGKSLTAYTVNTNTDNFCISLSRSVDGRNCEILSFNTSGDVTDSFSTPYRVISMSSYKGRVALLTPDSVYLYSKSGNKVSQTGVTNDPKSIVMYTSSDAYLLDISEITAVSL